MAKQLFDSSLSSRRQPLDNALRRELESAVIKGREIAEEAALAALTRLSVQESSAADYLSDTQRALRNRLRAHGRQLGDIKRPSGEQGVDKLISEVAYEHWHRMLFARFLEQNQLLMYDEHTSLTLEDCSELVKEDGVARDAHEARCQTGWELAGFLASKMLPQVFRIDSPVFEVELAPNHQRALEQLVTNLDPDTFQAQDSLGWVYQFWQTKRKEEVNKSEVKIGADELSPVTQLFTESYMVSFLLDNSLGAWWASKRLSETDFENAQSEQELREKAAIPDVPLSYLRFIKDENTGVWQPASGTFDSWPQQLCELKTLDPCCGSGHFLVAAFLMLVPMRMELEQLNPQQAVDRVLDENLHGLELDRRCVELAAFALALEAWRFPDTGGYRNLPELHLACSGLSITAAKEEWKELSRKTGKQNMTIALDWMHQIFGDAPVLGSLINPRRSKAAQIAQWSELQQLLGEALSQEQSQQQEAGSSEINNRIEAGIVAQGLAKAAELLASQYTWVITNVPYLARGKQSDTLKEYCEEYYSEGKNDLATAFFDRCVEFCVEGGTSSIVLPQNWLFLTSYRKFREKLLLNNSWHLIARLGAQAFQTPMWDFNVQLITLSRGNTLGQSADLLSSGEKSGWIRGVDVSEPRTAAEKAAGLVANGVKSVQQRLQLDNPDASVTLDVLGDAALINSVARPYKGLGTGDDPRYRRKHWEIGIPSSNWIVYRSAPKETKVWGQGNTDLLYWENGKGDLSNSPSAYLRNVDKWDQVGVLFGMMADLPCSVYAGTAWDTTSCALIPQQETSLPAIWCFAESSQFCKGLRLFNQKLSVEVNHFGQVPFDLDHWSKVAEQQYPNGLPQPYTNDPTQWIFHGHPCGTVIWDEETKWTANGELRVEDTVLQVAVARLLGYRWPAELDNEMDLAEEQHAWKVRCQDLEAHVDDDGIVCLPPVRGEKSADQRLEALLQHAYGQAWTTPLKNRLLEIVGSKSLSLWLRDKFFEQHCKLFQHRPFIWHVWDGLNDGFSALVNYHQLDKAGLERLIYTYLGDWIRTQQAGVSHGEDGAEIRLAAAEVLKRELESILQGEKPYDIFVRWKSLSQQPLGWDPDLNDGVRMNIRPFILAKDVGKKGAGILRFKPNIKWTKDRGLDVASAPCYHLGPEYGGKEGDRINEHHTELAEKRSARGLQ